MASAGVRRSGAGGNRADRDDYPSYGRPHRYSVSPPNYGPDGGEQRNVLYTGMRSRSRSHSPVHSRRHHRKPSRKSSSKYDYDSESSSNEYGGRRDRGEKSRGDRGDRDRYYHRKGGGGSGADHRRRRSNSRSRWERSHSDERRSARAESQDSDCSDELYSTGALDGVGYKSQVPNNTIMIRGLAQHITEADAADDRDLAAVMKSLLFKTQEAVLDRRSQHRVLVVGRQNESGVIGQDITKCGLLSKDIRLIRKKNSGASRGFAFVEFPSVQEATRWMENKQGTLMLQDQFRAVLQYSIPKDLVAAAAGSSAVGYLARIANGSSALSSSSGATRFTLAEKAMIAATKAAADWFCIKCGAQNFKRRHNCFKCQASRSESEEGGSGFDEICNYTTKTIMLRNLDALTTEETVMGVLSTQIPAQVKIVASVSIGRDPLTSTSRGICYLGTETTVDALTLFGALNGIAPSLSIDGKTVAINYCKYNMGDTKSVYSMPVTLSGFPNSGTATNYEIEDVQQLAEYTAGRYAKTDGEYRTFVDYYTSYFTQQISAGQSIILDNQMDAANAAAAVAQSAIQQRNASKSYFDTTQLTIPTGTDGKRYPVPDSTKYTHDKSSGYYYDSTTGLYYDPNSQYYWNSVIQKYLYWDRERLTYVLAPSVDSSTAAASSGAATGAEVASNAIAAQASAQKAQGNLKTPDGIDADGKKIGKSNEKHDKVKVAKKIAKDMERWAKTMNQRKEQASGPSSLPSNAVIGQQQPGSGALGVGNNNTVGDVGFSVLGHNQRQLSLAGRLNAGLGLANGYPDNRDPKLMMDIDQQGPLVAAYGGESGSSDEEADSAYSASRHSAGNKSSGVPDGNGTGDDNEFLDFSRLICGLCKRQLNSAEALTKHARLSELHRKNLAQLRGNTSDSSQQSNNDMTYRDRAKERRQMYGDVDEPLPSKLKEKYLKSRDDPYPSRVRDNAGGSASVLDPISAENVGNRLLQKMGWSEGQGLGKSNQGRTSIIQAEQRTANVGLGNKSIYTGAAGESYKDCVKKMMYARYQEIADRD